MYRQSYDFNPQGGSVTNLEFLVKTYGIPNTYIEVGVFEGITTVWFSDLITPHNKNFKLYAVDPHVGSDDMNDDFSKVKENFIFNINANTHKNITYISKSSKKGLIDLINQGVEAEIVYIDGDHTASTVLSDLVLSWQLLKVGGVMLCDDATFWRFIDNNGTESAQLSVRMAVEMFIQCNWHKIRPIQLPSSSQTAFIKIKE